MGPGTSSSIATASLSAAPRMAAVMLAGMLILAFAAWFYTIAVALCRVRVIMLERESGSGWVSELFALNIVHLKKA